MDSLLERERTRLTALVNGTPRPQPDAVAGIALIDILALLEKEQQDAHRDRGFAGPR